MLKKALVKILNRAYQKVSSEKNEEVIGVLGKRAIVLNHEKIYCNGYLLNGEFTYEEVKEINDITGYSAVFGMLEGVGPIALIGIANKDYIKQEGTFNPEIHEYGKLYNDDVSYKFTQFDEDTVKCVANYKVYGMFTDKETLNKISEKALFAKISYSLDSRYKEYDAENFKVYAMDCRLAGMYSYEDAKILATGTVEEKTGYSGGEKPIFFANVNGKNVGIIGVWQKETEHMTGFKDVWEYGNPEPEVQQIKFYTNEEAKMQKDYVLYLYNYGDISPRVQKLYNFEAKDHMLDERFCFYLDDGSDYRLK